MSGDGALCLLIGAALCLVFQWAWRMGQRNLRQYQCRLGIAFCPHSDRPRDYCMACAQEDAARLELWQKEQEAAS
jgi:hypothetical protein